MYHQGDRIIWELCLKGDRNAFEALYRKYYPILYNYGKLYTQDADIVKNCLQDFFLKLISNYANLSQPISIHAYLLKAFRHTLYNKLRSEQARHDIQTGYTDSVFSVKAEQIIDEEDYSPRNRLICHALKTLSSKQQEILYLYYIRELSHEEIAELLNINYQSSKNLLFRSITKLREMSGNENKPPTLPLFTTNQQRQTAFSGGCANKNIFYRKKQKNMSTENHCKL